MTNLFSALATALLLFFATAQPAEADEGGRRGESNEKEGRKGKDRHRPRRSVPEFDPAAASAVAALIAGGGILLARRRKKP